MRRVAAECHVARVDAPAVDRERQWLALCEWQPHALRVEELLRLRENAHQEFLVLADALVLARLELHQLHHEIAGAQLVVEAGLAAELGDELERVDPSAASALLLSHQHWLVLELHVACPALLQLLALRHFARLLPACSDRELVVRTHLEVNVGHFLCLGRVLLSDHLAALEARKDGRAQVALADLLAHLVHGLQHRLVEVDLLRRVDLELDAVLLDVDGRTLASDHADALVGVDLLLAGNVEELAADLREAAALLRVVENVVEKEFLEPGGVGGAVGRECHGVGLGVMCDWVEREVADVLHADQLRAEDELLADACSELVTRGAQHLVEEAGLL